MAGGYWHKNLRIDLSSERVYTEELDEVLLKNYIGGAGVAGVYLKREVPAETPPLSPGNLLIFSTGPFQATKISGGAKFSIVTRSPLTGIFVDSAAGAGWGVSFKKTGFDFLMIRGAASTPVYLNITDNKAEILPADELWGLDTLEVTKILMERHKGASVAAIGQAGENLNAMACIYVDGFSAAGRGGTGAVAGSKNLKAVVVNGSMSCPVAHPERLAELEKSYRKSIAQTAAGLREFGTVGGLVPGEEGGNLPVKNWSMVGWKEGAAKIGYPGYSSLNMKPHACSYCSIACHRKAKVEFKSGWKYSGPAPEYESLALLGASCMIDELELLVRANDFCNRSGIDTMSAGSCAAFAMEALEKGHTKGKTPSYQFGWGNGGGLLKFLAELVDGQGFGGIFSRGIREAAAGFDDEAASYASHVKGMDVPAHDPRVYYNLGLSYATGNRGACHMRAYSQISTMGALLPEAGIGAAPSPDTLEGAAEVVKAYQDFTAFYNSCVLCQFMIWGGLGLGGMIELLNVITGWDLDAAEVLKAGDRIFTTQRMLNNDWGVRAIDDRLPERFFQASKEGPRAGKYPEGLDDELSRLYSLRGWNAEGLPVSSKVEELEILRWI
ncbi:MAG: aldehyde ferredoxin oxidoreductase family protein [Spirochaetales bacterium]|nr:aldehyde ferredoxin oxidoreductase family protein [Spirochaetales bacterium]